VIDALADAGDGVIMDRSAEEVDGFVTPLAGRVIVGLLSGMVSLGMRVDAMVGVLIEVLEGTVIGVVPDIGADVLAGVDANMRVARMTVLESVPMPASLEEALLLNWEAPGCWSTAARLCRPVCPRTTCDQRFRPRDFRSLRTKNLHEHNEVYRIS